MKDQESDPYEDVSLNIAPALLGHVTKTGLLNSNGTIVLWPKYPDIWVKRGHFFDYTLEITISHLAANPNIFMLNVTIMN